MKINFADAGAKKYTDTWQKLIDEKLLAPVNGWTDDWYKGLGDGTIATLPTGAWMPANFATGVPSASGDWRVGPDAAVDQGRQGERRERRQLADPARAGQEQGTRLRLRQVRQRR